MAEVDVDHNGKMDLSEFILMMHKQVMLYMTTDPSPCIIANFGFIVSFLGF